ncbi:hypothetical protein PQO03_05275 [Lentisphaera profundi]|uniref:ParB/Sulfiredoxin domain-containing protein n=1 Tax=Lentisphaera profundi TaxID=1658616 RepID=A0ABY7VWV8_9BACT|nr:hypothetical protein [Lentisphaera profundi]WDE97362.1 hypothetical protein PQO03_05275 [Lentisphaera profundi]
MKLDIETIKVLSPYKDLFPIDKDALNKLINKVELDGLNGQESIVYRYIKNIGYVLVYGHIILEAATQAGLVYVNAIRVDFEDEEQAIKYALDKHEQKQALSKPAVTQDPKEASVDESTETEEEYIERRSRDYAKQIGEQLKKAGFDSAQIQHVLSLVEV